MDKNITALGDKKIRAFGMVDDREHIFIVKRDGKQAVLSIEKMRQTLERLSSDIRDDLSLDLIIQEVYVNIFHGISTGDVEKALLLATTAFIERSYAYDTLAMRLLLQRLYKEVFQRSITSEELTHAYRTSFHHAIQHGVATGLFDRRLLEFDLEKLAHHLKPERDLLFKYLGLQTLYGRYLKKIETIRIEAPQVFWMRVAMGLALFEENKEERAIEFYNTISQLYYVPSTPTLFHSGTNHPQLSSCFLTTIKDDLHHIFKCLGDNAQLSKWSGGVANDWTSLRATGSFIKSIQVSSQGVIPFLKIANDVTGAINRSGSRRGATVVYLETWHLDIEDFLDLRRNTGDERRRTHELNTAHWIPDLFMKRVELDGEWTLFSPDDVPDLHELYGKAFEEAYSRYEELVKQGKIKLYKVISAQKLWRRMLTRLFEFGHPWITFKDAANIRSPQDHAGVVHSSNLCTEITLNTSEHESAVCNLGSLNCARFIKNGQLDKELLASTIHTAMRMLDNVIDINFYPVKETEYANLKHRPVGLGIMGFQDALFMLDIPFSSKKALEWADTTQEFISYHALLASSLLAKERGTYQTYHGSKWDRGIFPLDTLDLLEQERGQVIECPRSSHMDWQPVRDHIARYGMRNSNTMAIAPTATISNIAGCYPCIEPLYKNVYVKANTDGEFTVINEYLMNDLKQQGLWNQEMCEKIKYYDGSIQHIDGIPAHLKEKYKTAFEIDASSLIKVTAARGKWVDQSQSHNVFLQGATGSKMHEIYFNAWRSGLKSTYYFRTLGVSQIEKSTLDAKKYGFTQKRTYNLAQEQARGDEIANVKEEGVSGAACGLDNDSCESCQ